MRIRKTEANDLLTYTALSAIVNEIKSPNQFIKRKLFGDVQTLETNNVSIDTVSGDRAIAPFIRENGEALMVAGTSEEFDVIKTPNIRIKRPFTPSELLFNRRPGVSIMPGSAGTIRQAALTHIARDMTYMADMVVNAEEYLCALALRGIITYSVSEEENFTITFAKPTANNVALTTGWNDPDPTAPTPDEDFYTAKKLIHDAHGLRVTDAIMGATAAAAFRRLMRLQNNTKTNFIDAGSITVSSQFDRDGVLYIGRFCGVDCWEYSRAASLAGTSTKLIRDEYVEFVCADSEAENKLYYGAISDMKTFGAKSFQAQRFSKSWEVEDPSAMIALLASRPCPVMRRPGSVVSMDVIV